MLTHNKVRSTGYSKQSTHSATYYINDENKFPKTIQNTKQWINIGQYTNKHTRNRLK